MAEDLTGVLPQGYPIKGRLIQGRRLGVGGQALPLLYYHFDGINMRATMPGWSPLSSLYEVTCTSIPEVLGPNRRIWSADGNFFIRTQDTPGDQYRTQFTTVTGGVITIQVDGAVALTLAQSSLLSEGDGVSYTINGLSDQSRTTSAGSAMPEATSIGAHPNNIEFTQGPIWNMQFQDNSPLQNRDVYTGDNNRGITAPTFSIPNGNNFIIEFDWIKRANESLTFTTMLGSAVAAQNEISIFNNDGLFLANNGAANVTIAGAFTNVGIGDQCSVRIVRTNVQDIEAFVNDISVGSTILGGAFNFTRIGMRAANLAPLATDSSMANVRVTNTSTDAVIFYPISEGTGVNILAFDGAGVRVPTSDGTLTPNAAWNLIADNTRLYRMEATAATVSDTLSCVDGRGIETPVNDATILNYNAANWEIITVPPIWISDIPILFVEIGVPFAYDLAQHLNGIAGTFCDLDSGTLPAGIEVRDNLIQGTTTEFSTYFAIVIAAANADGSANSNAFELTVEAPVLTQPEHWEGIVTLLPRTDFQGDLAQNVNMRAGNEGDLVSIAFGIVLNDSFGDGPLSAGGGQGTEIRHAPPVSSPNRIEFGTTNSWQNAEWGDFETGARLDVQADGEIRGGQLRLDRVYVSGVASTSASDQDANGPANTLDAIGGFSSGSQRTVGTMLYARYIRYRNFEQNLYYDWTYNEDAGTIITNKAAGEPVNNATYNGTEGLNWQWTDGTPTVVTIVDDTDGDNFRLTVTDTVIGSAPITAYTLYLDSVEQVTQAGTTFDLGVPPLGTHNYTISATNVVGEGVQSTQLTYFYGDVETRREGVTFAFMDARANATHIDAPLADGTQVNAVPVLAVPTFNTSTEYTWYMRSVITEPNTWRIFNAGNEGNGFSAWMYLNLIGSGNTVDPTVRTTGDFPDTFRLELVTNDHIFQTAASGGREWMQQVAVPANLLEFSFTGNWT